MAYARYVQSALLMNQNRSLPAIQFVEQYRVVITDRFHRKYLFSRELKEEIDEKIEQVNTFNKMKITAYVMQL